MNSGLKAIVLAATIGVAGCAATQGQFLDAKNLFENADESSTYFNNSYGYALFPNIGKGGVIVGGARGTGGVFRDGKKVGESTITELTAGFQFGGQAYSQIIFLEDKRAFDEFCSGSFEFDATASAVAASASVSASAATNGSSTSQSKSQNDADSYGRYHKGAAVFTITKGGAMYEASLGGQRFSTKC